MDVVDILTIFAVRDLSPLPWCFVQLFWPHDSSPHLYWDPESTLHSLSAETRHIIIVYSLYLIGIWLLDEIQSCRLYRKFSYFPKWNGDFHIAEGWRFFAGTTAVPSSCRNAKWRHFSCFQISILIIRNWLDRWDFQVGFTRKMLCSYLFSPYDLSLHIVQH